MLSTYSCAPFGNFPFLHPRFIRESHIPLSALCTPLLPILLGVPAGPKPLFVLRLRLCLRVEPYYDSRPVLNVRKLAVLALKRLRMLQYTLLELMRRLGSLVIFPEVHHVHLPFTHSGIFNLPRIALHLSLVYPLPSAMITVTSLPALLIFRCVQLDID